MKINNINEDYLDNLEQKEYNSKLKYKNRDKKIKESFTFEDLLNEKMRKRILEYMDR